MERTIGACGKVGFALFPKSTQIKTIMEAGAEDILFSDFSFREQELNSFKDYIKEEKFRSGLMGWIGYSLIKDARNHELYPTEGYKAEFNQRLVFPLTSTEFSMAKTELTGHYFFPLLPKGKLTFGMHGKLGIIGQLSNDKPIPYKELYHVGGPGSLRGFRWGEAGPFFAPSELPVGAKNMALLSLELTTPLGGSAYDMSTPRGYVFYDIGGGWNTPKPKNSIMTSILEEHGAKKISDIFHDNFHLRHTIGFGLKLSAPTPITVEWGYKLDRKALSSERPSEMHISMNLPF
jgi:outer membrane protein insertion porin family